MLTMVERNVELTASDRFNTDFMNEQQQIDLWTRTAYEFHQFLREQGDDFLQTVDDWLSAHSVRSAEDGRAAKTCRVGTGVYMFASE